ncbi:MAG: hypothetical protein UU48_C0014G0022 [Candidatus Uhrbacteria bacterium GW2011_GWF2_41_16]|uniref:Uncharacterized protein n=1 Tax=Candidatus Uhrbacteria bacterium GW2011_GWF2_41_16 TaxID=1618997 RepID=A0A0G0V950_9BACT|nr:MAG: hypothetical protein UU48_C0014G0022 [Candidatus Uhrbacteria bacterium GW2011_GWF2_41_16]
MGHRIVLKSLYWKEGIPSPEAHEQMSEPETDTPPVPTCETGDRQHTESKKEKKELDDQQRIFPRMFYTESD